VLRLYLDEDAQQSALVAALRQLGFDCLTVDMAGARGAAGSDHCYGGAGAGDTFKRREMSGP
jgi:hypothetical protein